MVLWILLALGLYMVSVYAPAALYLPTEGLMRHLGARDSLPDADAVTGRARRAHANLMENMPIFVTLAILSMIVTTADTALALLGAKVFVIARAAYLPAYISGIPGLRSACYTVGLVGCGAMAWSLI